MSPSLGKWSIHLIFLWSPTRLVITCFTPVLWLWHSGVCWTSRWLFVMFALGLHVLLSYKPNILSVCLHAFLFWVDSHDMVRMLHLFTGIIRMSLRYFLYVSTNFLPQWNTVIVLEEAGVRCVDIVANPAELVKCGQSLDDGDVGLEEFTDIDLFMILHRAHWWYISSD